MSLGYNRPLYLLPFDHRHSYVIDMFKYTPPLTTDEYNVVADSKFAVGRTTFWDAVADYEAKRATRPEAASRIAERFREWAAIFVRARPSSTSVA